MSAITLTSTCSPADLQLGQETGMAENDWTKEVLLEIPMKSDDYFMLSGNCWEIFKTFREANGY